MSSRSFLISHFIPIFPSFSLPFHHGLLAVNIGLSLPSKAAHQLPWLPSVCVRVKGRKGEREKKNNTMYQRSRHAFMPVFGLAWVLLTIIFPSPFFFTPSKAKDALQTPSDDSTEFSFPQRAHLLKDEISCFCGEMEATFFFWVCFENIL